MQNQNAIQRGNFKCYICPANETNNGRVIAVTTYKGRTVRGVAVCSLDNTFDEDYGCELAIARCKCKIADIRYDFYDKAYPADTNAYIEALRKQYKSGELLAKAYLEVTEAQNNYLKILHMK